MSKTAVVVLSDPKTGTEDALGRVVNAMAVAYDGKQSNDEVIIVFQSSGTRWPEILQKEEHPFHGLYKAVEEQIRGVSSGCADVFGAHVAEIPLINDNTVPGTSGMASFLNLQKEGYSIITF